MFLRLLSLSLAALIVALQYPLWLGKGGWFKVWQHETQLEQAEKVNEGLKHRNDALEAEVMDLKQGFDAIEERARHELGMIKQDELFIQILNTQNTTPAPAQATSNVVKSED
ncbi:cell division protein FtsB [Leeia sp. TBRC 13508]|uniref:Cell division protein FtsB n=1 Tax=Leeia speluncae TaxID=2884804 RepID=A0ABS8D984_9NEIS|nr:cell division protein FtsB [Leeia speluncae]MCB6184784.1 cell division protein FtsB [Leeia speluncae]